MGFPSGSAVKNLPAVQEKQEMQVQSLGQEDPLEEGVANPFQYSCLENSMDGGAWWATVHEVKKSQTRLSDFTDSLTLLCFRYTHWKKRIALPGGLATFLTEKDHGPLGSKETIAVWGQGTDPVQ